jgi:hypothetical protein
MMIVTAARKISAKDDHWDLHLNCELTMCPGKPLVRPLAARSVLATIPARAASMPQ